MLLKTAACSTIIISLSAVIGCSYFALIRLFIRFILRPGVHFIISEQDYMIKVVNSS